MPNKIVALFVLALLSGCSQRAPSSASSSTVTTMASKYIGAPGPVPPLSSNPVVSAYGAFTFTSPENYCHMVRWIISNTVLPEYENEPRPIAYPRGTKVRVDNYVESDCTSSSGAAMSVEDANLVEVTVLPGQLHAGSTRFILESDLHDAGEYIVYAKKHQAETKATDASKAPLIAFTDGDSM